MDLHNYIKLYIYINKSEIFGVIYDPIIYIIKSEIWRNMILYYIIYSITNSVRSDYI